MVEMQIYPKTIQLHQMTHVFPANMEINGTVCMHMYLGQGIILYNLDHKNCYNEHKWRLQDIYIHVLGFKPKWISDQFRMSYNEERQGPYRTLVGKFLGTLKRQVNITRMELHGPHSTICLPGSTNEKSIFHEPELRDKQEQITCVLYGIPQSSI